MNTAFSRTNTPSADETSVPVAPPTGEAARPDLRTVVASELSALLNRETNRRNNEWRATLELVRGALLALDRTWGAAGGKLESPTSASAVGDLVEAIVAEARRETDSAVRQARAEAQVETARFVDLVGRLNEELQAERDQLKATREAVNVERDLRGRAEAACRNAERDKANAVAQISAHAEAVQAELEAGRALVAQLRQQIDAEKSERAKLFAVVQTVQRAVSSPERLASKETTDREAIGHEDRTPAAAPVPKNVQADPPAIAKQPHTPESVHAQPLPEKLWNPALVTVTERLFEEIERKYLLEVQANLSPADMVDKLLVNLRIGHADLRQSCSSDAEANGLFERQMLLLLDSKAATTFGRHLSIAACEWVMPHDRKTANG